LEAERNNASVPIPFLLNTLYLMDVKEAIENRRSIRKYKTKEVSDDEIRTVIDAARLAPSGNNAQPSTYYIIKDMETKTKLRENDVFSQEFVYTAPVIIVCCGDSTAYTKHVEQRDSPDEMRTIRDVSIASSFLVLRATELDLGTCYIGWLKAEKLKEMLKIPKHNIIPYIITMGYPAENPEPRPRKSLDEIIL